MIKQDAGSDEERRGPGTPIDLNKPIVIFPQETFPHPRVTLTVGSQLMNF